MRLSRSGRKRNRSVIKDERAIEGLPIRLVIALVVGVAALGVMLGVLGTFDFGASTELTAEIDDPVQDGNDLTVEVFDENGEEVQDVQIIIEGDTLNLDQPLSGSTGASSNQDSITIDSSVTDWNTNQDTGTLTISLQGPGDGDYTDDQSNPEVLVHT